MTPGNSSAPVKSPVETKTFTITKLDPISLIYREDVLTVHKILETSDVSTSYNLKLAQESLLLSIGFPGQSTQIWLSSQQVESHHPSAHPDSEGFPSRLPAYLSRKAPGKEMRKVGRSGRSRAEPVRTLSPG